MDIIVESVNQYGHIFRIRLPRQISPIGMMRVRGSLERNNHRHIRSMNDDGHSLHMD